MWAWVYNTDAVSFSFRIACSYEMQPSGLYKCYIVECMNDGSVLRACGHWLLLLLSIWDCRFVKWVKGECFVLVLFYFVVLKDPAIPLTLPRCAFEALMLPPPVGNRSFITDCSETETLNHQLLLTRDTWIVFLFCAANPCSRFTVQLMILWVWKDTWSSNPQRKAPKEPPADGNRWWFNANQQISRVILITSSSRSGSDGSQVSSPLIECCLHSQRLRSGSHCAGSRSSTEGILWPSVPCCLHLHLH